MQHVLGANAAVDAVYRADWGRIVATLIRQVGDFDAAEEAAQEAFASAVDQWPASGVPDVPRAWIIRLRGTRPSTKSGAGPDSPTSSTPTPASRRRGSRSPTTTPTRSPTIVYG